MEAESQSGRFPPANPGRASRRGEQDGGMWELAAEPPLTSSSLKRSAWVMSFSLMLCQGQRQSRSRPRQSVGGPMVTGTPQHCLVLCGLRQLPPLMRRRSSQPRVGHNDPPQGALRFPCGLSASHRALGPPWGASVASPQTHCFLKYVTAPGLTCSALSSEY